MINGGDNGNNLVETKRGIKNTDMKFEFDINLQQIMQSNNNGGLIDTTNYLRQLPSRLHLLQQ